MAELYGTAACLRIFGDDLDPDEITSILGAKPTRGERKGGIWLTPRGDQMIARTGRWSIDVARREPGDLDGQIAEILAPLNQDLLAWQDLTTRFRADFFCGLFMEEGNEGLELSPKTMLDMGARGIKFGLDIYAPKRRTK